MFEKNEELLPGIVSWQPVLTDHQAFTLEAFGSSAEANVVVFSTKPQDEVRREQGWLPTRAIGLRHEILPDTGWFEFVVTQLREHKKSVHVFGSPFENVKLMVALILAAVFRLEFYLISEPFSPVSDGYFADKKKALNWLKSKVRPFLYYTYGKFLRKSVAGIFGISPLAITQYLRAGIPEGKLFPFGYFVPVEKYDVAKSFFHHAEESSDLRLIFVGSLIARKGVGELIVAVRLLCNQGFKVSADFFGPGDDGAYSFDQFSRFCGRIPFGCAQRYISQYDVLVVPSRFDGWGVVVNEALMVGVPVICTNQVGSSALVKKWRCGKTYNASDVGALVSALRDMLMDRDELVRMEVAAAHAGGLLTPSVAGRYMLDVIKNVRGQGPKPKCPWYDL